MKKLLLLSLLLTLVFVGSYLAFQSNLAMGSVTIGNEYHATTTTSGSASSTSFYTARVGSGTLGSVTISSSSPVTTYPPLKIYDGTASVGTTTGAAAASTTLLVQFGPQNQTHGTYTFDLIFKKGLLIETPAGFNGIFTITYR